MRRIMLAGVAAFLLFSFAGCELNSDLSSSEDGIESPNELQPIHQIQLEDGGEVEFYVTGNGEITTFISTKSAELFETLNQMNCIRICEEYGDGIIPDALREAYEISVGLSENQLAEDSSTTEESNGAKGNPLNLPNPSNPYGYVPNWTFDTFARRTQLWEPGINVGCNNHFDLESVQHAQELRKLFKNKTEDYSYTIYTCRLATACYVVSGSVRFKLKYYHEAGPITSGWHTLRKKTVEKGYFCGYRKIDPYYANGELRHKYKVIANVDEKVNTKYHFFLRVRNANL